LGQLRLWRFQRVRPDSPHYNVPRAVRLEGPLDVGFLEESIRRVASRHAILTTVYRGREGRPLQIERGSGEPKLPVVDLRRVADAPDALDRLLADEIGEPFDLEAGPLMRATLVRVADAEHVLLVSAHHIAADCWSMGMPFGDTEDPGGRWLAGVFFRELWSLYHALAEGRPLPLGDRARSFAEVAARQNEWLTSEEAREQLAHWRRTLAGAKALEVPPDFPRPPEWDFAGARPRVSLAPALTRGLRDLAGRCGATLFATVLAVFELCLHRATGCEDVVVGTTAANRVRWDAEDLIGFFSNDLVLRTSLAGDPTFEELVGRVRETAFSAYARQELPFERILGALAVAPDPSRHPLFQVRFILHEPRDRAFSRSGLRLVPVVTGREVAKYDLTLLLADDGEALSGWLEYATSLYSPATIDRMVREFGELVRAAVAEPGRRISQIAGAV
jgi:aspartate racemase